MTLALQDQQNKPIEQERVLSEDTSQQSLRAAGMPESPDERLKTAREHTREAGVSRIESLKDLTNAVGEFIQAEVTTTPVVGSAARGLKESGFVLHDSVLAPLARSLDARLDTIAVIRRTREFTRMLGERMEKGLFGMASSLKELGFTLGDYIRGLLRPRED